MGYKWIQWLKDYNGNKINLCVPIGVSAQDAADDADNYLSFAYQGWQPPSYNTWGLFPFNIALAQSCIANATAAGCEDVNFYMAVFPLGSNLQYHFVSGETITTTSTSQYLQSYFISLFAPSAGINLMYSWSTNVSLNVDDNPYRYPAIGIDEENHKAIFCSVTVSKGYADPDPQGGVTIEVMTRTDASRTQFYNAILSSVPPVKQDPYNAGGNSNEQLQTGDSTGNFDDSSDQISVPAAPTLDLSTTDLIQAYVPDVADIHTLATYMWNNFDKTDVAKDLSKLFADPRDGIVALFMLPFSPDKSVVKRLASIGSFPVAGLEMYTLSKQFKQISCGSVSLAEYYGNYLDYNPYTRITLFLPFVGEVQLDPDEVMGETVSVDYTVDCMTGEFVAFVSTSTKVLSQYQGNCAAQVPITSADYSRLNSALLQAAIGAVGTVAAIATGGGALAGAAAVGSTAAGAATTALNVMNSKVNHSHSGALGGTPGFMGIQTPYLIIHRARQSVPPDANTFKGYPCNGAFILGDLKGTGFTKVSDVILNDVGYTEAELEELRQILADGIIL